MTVSRIKLFCKAAFILDLCFQRQLSFLHKIKSMELAKLSSASLEDNWLDAAALERGLLAHDWHRPSIWYIDRTRNTSTPGISASALLGVFARKTFDMNLSMPEPLPHESVNMLDPDGKVLSLCMDGNIKEHQTITSLQLRPLGFELRWKPSGGEAGMEALLNRIAQAEFYRRHCPGPSPSLPSSTWMRDLEGYEPYRSSLRGYWNDVLNQEVCPQFPQLSFIFGVTRNPINPLLMPLSVDSSKSTPKASSDSWRPNGAHLTEAARNKYFLIVLMQCWMSVNGRFVIHTSNSAIRPTFVVSLDVNDCTSDCKGNLTVADGIAPMFEQSKRIGIPFPEPFRRPATSTAASASASSSAETKKKQQQQQPNDPLATLIDTNPILASAWNLASMARHLNFGRFVEYVDNVFRTHTGYSLVSREDMDNMKKNVPSAFGGRGFVFAATPNLLEIYRESMMRASNLALNPAGNKNEAGDEDVPHAASAAQNKQDATFSPPPSSASILKLRDPKKKKKPLPRVNNTTVSMKEYKASRPHRTNNDNQFLKASKIRDITLRLTAPIPAQSGRKIKVVKCDNSIPTPPTFMTHAQFSPTRPIARFDVSFSSTSGWTGRIDPTFCWMLAHFMTQGDVDAFGKHLVKGHYVVNAKSDNANITRYFCNPANEPVLFREYGARIRYRTYLDERLRERYAHYSRIPRIAPALTTELSKHAHNVKRAAASSFASASESLSLGDPLPEAIYKGIIDPSTQSPDTLNRFMGLQRRAYDHAKFNNPSLAKSMDRFLTTFTERCSDLKRLFGDKDASVLTGGAGSLPSVSLFDIYMALASEMGEAFLWFLFMSVEMSIRGKSLDRSETGYLFALELVSIRWAAGIDVLRYRKKAALQKIGYNNDDPQDRNVIRGVYNAFLPENPTYNPAAETLIRANLEFDRRFFVPARIRSLLTFERFVLRTNDVRCAPMDSLLDDVITAVCNSVSRKSELTNCLTPTLLSFLFARDGTQLQRVCSGITSVDGKVENKHPGMHLFQHIIDLYIEHVKHPIFVFAAYICHPPVGAVSSVTGCEWVKPNSTPRTTRPMAASATTAAATAAGTTPTEKQPSPTTPMTSTGMGIVLPERPSTPSTFLVPAPRGSPITPRTPASDRSHPSPSTSKLIISTNSRDSTTTQSYTAIAAIPAASSSSSSSSSAETYTEPFKTIKDRVQHILTSTVRKKNLRVDDYFGPQNYQTVADLCVAIHMSELVNHVPAENNKRQRIEQLFKYSKDDLVRRLIDKLGFRSDTLLAKTDPSPADEYVIALQEVKQVQFIADDTLDHLYRLKVQALKHGAETFDAMKLMGDVASDIKRLCDDDKVLNLKFDRFVSEKNQRQTSSAAYASASASVLHTTANGYSNNPPFIVFGTPRSRAESISITICHLILRLQKRGSSLG